MGHELATTEVAREQCISIGQTVYKFEGRIGSIIWSKNKASYQGSGRAAKHWYGFKKDVSNSIFCTVYETRIAIVATCLDIASYIRDEVLETRPEISHKNVVDSCCRWFLTNSKIFQLTRTPFRNKTFAYHFWRIIVFNYFNESRKENN